MNYSRDIYLNYFLTCAVDVPGFFLVTYFSNAIGRKKTTLIGCLLSRIFISMVPVIPKSLKRQYAFKMSITIIARLCCSVAFSSVWVWTSELFPTVVRAQGMAICGIFEKVVMIAVPLMSTLIQSFAYYVPFVVMGVMGVLGFLVGLPLPETMNQPTRESFEDFFPKPDSNTRQEGGIDNVASEQV